MGQDQSQFQSTEIDIDQSTKLRSLNSTCIADDKNPASSTRKPCHCPQPDKRDLHNYDVELKTKMQSELRLKDNMYISSRKGIQKNKNVPNANKSSVKASIPISDSENQLKKDEEDNIPFKDAELQLCFYTVDTIRRKYFRKLKVIRRRLKKTQSSDTSSIPYFGDRHHLGSHVAYALQINQKDISPMNYFQYRHELNKLQKILKDKQDRNNGIENIVQDKQQHGCEEHDFETGKENDAKPSDEIQCSHLLKNDEKNDNSKKKPSRIQSSKTKQSNSGLKGKPSPNYLKIKPISFLSPYKRKKEKSKISSPSSIDKRYTENENHRSENDIQHRDSHVVVKTTIEGVDETNYISYTGQMMDIRSFAQNRPMDSKKSGYYQKGCQTSQTILSESLHSISHSQPNFPELNEPVLIDEIQDFPLNQCKISNPSNTALLTRKENRNSYSCDSDKGSIPEGTSKQNKPIVDDEITRTKAKKTQHLISKFNTKNSIDRFTPEAIRSSKAKPVSLVQVDPLHDIYICDIGLTRAECYDIIGVSESCSRGLYTAYTYAKQTLGCREYNDLAAICKSPVMIACSTIRYHLGNKKYHNIKNAQRNCNKKDDVKGEVVNKASAKLNTEQKPERTSKLTEIQEKDLVLDDREPHMVKYDVTKFERRKLDMHTDKSDWTFLIALSQGMGIDYDGGGTYFECCDTTVHLQQGQALIFPGKLRHRGQKISTGLRFLLVGFLVEKAIPSSSEAEP